MTQIQTDKIFGTSFSPGLWPSMQWPPEFWMGLLDNISLPVLVFDSQGRLLLSNCEASRILGLGGAVGHLMPQYLSDLRTTPFELGSPLKTSPVRINTGDGPYLFTVRMINVDGLVPASVAVGEKEKPAAPSLGPTDAVGDSAAMAGMVSQTVKGPLAGIELYASILDEELAADLEPGLAEVIDSIRVSVREVNEYLTSFESMTRNLFLDINPIDISEAIDEALSALGEIFKAKGIGLLVEHKTFNILADRRLMVQLFLNLFLNAVEAMPHGGRLLVEVRQNKDGQVEVSVTDTGPGLGSLQPREVFNPFFTTKNQPLGLGLPVSRRIIEAHQGQLKVGSDLVMGAKVTVTLPCIDEPVEKALN
ncbi:MAG: HAMP domain-containing histidine kinase [Deltaproteobacteria bacterium]|jgi:nitrogen fixation/metabolism regulation signal transduction histidine kinase|nr:HAMP domain-containing histidine kinase [Deltaproteobacteria bacterium]